MVLFAEYLFPGTFENHAPSLPQFPITEPGLCLPRQDHRQRARVPWLRRRAQFGESHKNVQQRDMEWDHEVLNIMRDIKINQFPPVNVEAHPRPAGTSSLVGKAKSRGEDGDCWWWQR